MSPMLAPFFSPFFGFFEKLQGKLRGRLRGRPRGPQAMEIEAKQHDKGTLFWSSKRKKKQPRKNGPPQCVLFKDRLRCSFKVV